MSTRTLVGSFVIALGCMLGHAPAHVRAQDAGGSNDPAPAPPAASPSEAPPTAAPSDAPSVVAPSDMAPAAAPSGADPSNQTPANRAEEPSASTPAEPAADSGQAEYGASANVQRAGASETPRNGTGSKQGVPLEELPASISSIDAEELRVRGVNNVDEALTLTSGVSPTWQYGGFLHLGLRGMQAITLFDGHRDSRAIFADSAPQQGVFDLERIEVLRGPTSVLYGYGAVGGVVNLIRKQASRRSAYELDFGLGLPNQQLLHAGAQGPLGEHLSYRIDVGRVARTDYRGALTERNQVSAVIRYTPTTRHTFDLRLSYALDHYNTDVGIPTVQDPRHPGQWVLPPNARLENRYSTGNDHLDYKRFAADLDYRFDVTDDTFVRAHAGIARDDYEYLAAESLTYVPPMDMTPAIVEREYLPFARAWMPVVGQLELHSHQETGPLDHQLVFGYEVNQFGGDTHNATTGDVEPGSVDFRYPVDEARKVAFQTRSINHYRHLTHSLYGFDHLKILPNLIATGGVRFDTVRSRVSKKYVDGFSGDEIANPATGMRAPVLRSHREALTGQAGLVFTPWNPLTAYVGYSSAFKPVFINPGEPETNTWSPERGQQVEAGLRGRVDADGHHLEVDGAVYWLEKRNVVISRGMDDYSQAGKLRSTGAELSFSYHAPRVLSLTAGYSFNDATYRSFVQPDPVTGENQSLRGKQVEFAPRHTGSAWLGLRITEELGLGIGARLMAEQYADPENRVRMPDYALVDTSAWFKSGRAHVILSVRNLFDERGYYGSVINQWAENPQVTPGPGREVLCTLRLTL